jgi:hypothetical protein
MRKVPSFPVIILIATVAAGAAPPASPADRQAMHDFGLGDIVGECVVAGCEIFSGTVSTSFTELGHPVPVFVNRWILGNSPSVGEEIVNVPYGTSRDPDAAIWADATVVQGGGVTVIFGLGEGMFFGAGEAALVTSSPRDQGIIQSLADEAARLEAAPGRIADLVVGLSQDQNSALAGYILSNLERKGLFWDPERAEDLLGQLTLSPTMPQEVEEGAVAHMVLHYFRLSDRGKEGVLQRLAQLALLQAALRAKAGYGGLAKIFPFDDEAPARIPPDVAERLVKNYRALVKSGSMSRNPELEKGLKIE